MTILSSALLALLAAPRPVGFSVQQLEDRSRLERTAPAGQPPSFRPMQLAFWYPAQDESSGAAQTFADYVHLRASERGEEASDARRKSCPLREHRPP